MTFIQLRSLVLIFSLSPFIFSCGLSRSAPPITNSGTATTFDYEDFIARTPVDHLDYDEENSLDSADYDPAASDVERTLQAWDQILENAGVSTRVDEGFAELSTRASACKRSACSVWANVNRSSQVLHLYVDGVLKDSWAVSTGIAGYGTPKFDTHPDGRVYNKYSSKSFPGGDYNGLGNMPYAVFIKGGYAIHGTPKVNWKHLGRKASHGCIRLHPDNGYRFNRLVREVGIGRTWVTVI